MNVQFAIKDGEIYVLEVNPRASRTVPFVAKATGVPIAKIAARVMAGEKLAALRRSTTAPTPPHVAVKEAVFPFARFPGVDPILGPEMKSTGEVMGLDRDFAAPSPRRSSAPASTCRERHASSSRSRTATRRPLVPIAPPAGRRWASSCSPPAAPRTRSARPGLPVTPVNKVLEGRPHIVDAMKSGEIQLVFNTTEGAQAIADSFSFRRTALTHNIPYYTTVAGRGPRSRRSARCAQGSLEVAPLQSYLRGHFRDQGLGAAALAGAAVYFSVEWTGMNKIPMTADGLQPPARGA